MGVLVHECAGIYLYRLYWFCVWSSWAHEYTHVNVSDCLLSKNCVKITVRVCTKVVVVGHLYLQVLIVSMAD